MKKMCHPEVLQYMQRSIKKFANYISEPILDVGSYNVNGNSRQFFHNKEWIGLDIRSGPDVTRVENIETTSLLDNSIGTVICTSTLEHVRNPIKACEQIYRILKEDALFLVAVPFSFGVHEYPDDYWRFTPSCVKNIIFHKMKVLEIVGPDRTQMIYGCAVKHCTGVKP